MKGERLLFIGGDKRRLYTEQYFTAKGYTAVSYEKNPDEFLKCFENNVTVILPLPFSRDGKTLNIAEGYEKMYIKDFLKLLKKGDRVMGGMLSEEFRQELFEMGVEAFEYYCDNLILENAQLTADAVFQLLCENGIDIRNSKYALTGFGRTAKAIAERLYDRGLDFYVTARSESAKNDAVSMNYNYVKLCDFTDKIKEADIIINTVPALILSEELLNKAKQNVLIVDIASAPFGVEKDTAEKCGARLIRALGLPAKYYPKRAGELVGKKAESLL